MKKFKFLVSFGIKKRIARKAFVIANVVIFVLMLGVINIPAIIALFSDDDETAEMITIQVVDETGQDNLAATLNTIFNMPYGDEPRYEVTGLETTAFVPEAFWEEEDGKDVTIVFTGDFKAPDVDIYSKQDGISAMLFSQIELLVTASQIEDYRPPVFTEHFAPDYEDPEARMLASSVLTALLVPLFLLVTMGTQFVGVDIIEEKSTKAIETIIASVPAKIHFFSKITAAILFIMIQSLLLLSYGAIASLVAGAASSGLAGLPGGTSLLSYLGEMFPNWRLILFVTLMFMIGGTVLYLVIAAFFASMATTQEDYQQFQSPLMLTLVAAFYIGIFAPTAGAYGFLKVMAFVPIFTPIVAPVAYASGAMTLAETAIAFVVVSGVTVLAVYLVAPVYKVAILSYDQTKVFSRIGAYIKKGFQSKKKTD
jgi:ABC-2 type transport system permease protein